MAVMARLKVLVSFAPIRDKGGTASRVNGEGSRNTIVLRRTKDEGFEEVS